MPTVKVYDAVADLVFEEEVSQEDLDAQAAQGKIDNWKPRAQGDLMATDWTVLPDAGLTTECVNAFKTYRATLRGIRTEDNIPDTYPTKPTVEWS